MSLRDWEDCIDEDFPEMPPITAQVRKQMLEESSRFRSSARIANACVWEDREFEVFRRKELETALP